jgi:hypothetical protein
VIPRERWSSARRVIATGLFLAGCIFIARAKGRPWYYGLFGLLSLVGLAILWFAVADKDPSGATKPA